jgi:hypothetical protein
MGPQQSNTPSLFDIKSRIDGTLRDLEACAPHYPQPHQLALAVFALKTVLDPASFRNSYVAGLGTCLMHEVPSKETNEGVLAIALFAVHQSGRTIKGYDITFMRENPSAASLDDRRTELYRLKIMIEPRTVDEEQTRARRFQGTANPSAVGQYTEERFTITGASAENFARAEQNRLSDDDPEALARLVREEIGV